MAIYFAFIFFLLGVAVGSFINVLIDRIPKGIPFWRGRSFCDHCRHKLAWFDLIPIVSFVVLKRKCRYCGQKISWQYPIVELTTGLLFVFLFPSILYPLLSTNNPLSSIIYYPSSIIYHLIILSGLITIFFTDLKYRIIPDSILAVLVVATLIFQTPAPATLLKDSLPAALGLFLFFLTLVLATRGRGMGLGDVKFAFFMGLFLGIKNTVIAFYLSFLTGAVISLILIIAGKKSMKSAIPFGPFLVVSTGLAYLYGDRLWIIFMRMMGI